jgi:hypothetical protein
MKPLVITAIVAMTLLGGCREERTLNPQYDDVQYNRWLSETINDSQADAALVRQHTLWPWHFVEDSSDLNELGRENLKVLAAHYCGNPGPLNIRRGAEAKPLYDRRVQTVVKALADAGVGAERVEISDGMPGGDGRPSEDVLVILAPEAKKNDDNRGRMRASSPPGGANERP